MNIENKRQSVFKLSTGIVAAACLVVGGLITALVITGIIPNPFQTPPLASFTERGVSVEIFLDRGGADGPRLTGIFTPTDGEFHLYSKDLPRDGLEGIGRPTLMEIASAEGVKATGPLSVDQPIVENRVDALGLSFPVYPEGSVSLHLPISIAETGAPTPVELSVTYMACKGGACLPPVIDKHVSVVIQAD